MRADHGKLPVEEGGHLRKVLRCFDGAQHQILQIDGTGKTGTLIAAVRRVEQDDGLWHAKILPFDAEGLGQRDEVGHRLVLFVVGSDLRKPLLRVPQIPSGIARPEAERFDAFLRLVGERGDQRGGQKVGARRLGFEFQPHALRHIGELALNGLLQAVRKTGKDVPDDFLPLIRRGGTDTAEYALPLEQGVETQFIEHDRRDKAGGKIAARAHEIRSRKIALPQLEELGKALHHKGAERLVRPLKALAEGDIVKVLLVNELRFQLFVGKTSPAAQSVGSDHDAVRRIGAAVLADVHALAPAERSGLLMVQQHVHILFLVIS